MGITGARADVDSAARGLLSRLRAVGSSSACVGLGVSTPEQVREILGYADGAIVGSLLVKALADGGVDAVASAAALLATGKSPVDAH
jgi:tryptophan synthase alpha chain